MLESVVEEDQVHWLVVLIVLLQNLVKESFGCHVVLNVLVDPGLLRLEGSAVVSIQ